MSLLTSVWEVGLQIEKFFHLHTNFSSAVSHPRYRERGEEEDTASAAFERGRNFSGKKNFGPALLHADWPRRAARSAGLFTSLFGFTNPALIHHWFWPPPKFPSEKILCRISPTKIHVVYKNVCAFCLPIPLIKPEIRLCVQKACVQKRH